mgnify:CR=1 FL=1
MKKPSVELRLPILPNMELIATQTAEVISRHMNLTEDQAGEISMALIEACINAFEHSKAENNVFINFLIEDDSLVIKVIDQGIGFDKTKVEIPKIENKIEEFSLTAIPKINKMPATNSIQGKVIAKKFIAAVGSKR